MPRENRKRGKKHKQQYHEEEHKAQDVELPKQRDQEENQKPSWIVNTTSEQFNAEAPFGYVENDVKAYFRTVDVQMKDWQEHQPDVTEEGDADPNEERRLFFMAALNEMQGKEKMLATDPDCSVVLERMSYSMDDFVRRVFVDRLAGSYEVLVKHRFASHVCQTFFTVARETISRETRGVFTAVPESEESGTLPTLTQLILDICEELLPVFPSLLLDPFASHVVRALLVLLSPSLSGIEEGTVRSKKSANWKARQGKMKSVFDEDKGKGKETTWNRPVEFQKMACRLVVTIRNQLDDNEVRAMAANKVACPGLQTLLQVEADQDMSNAPGSLMDRVMVGIISTCQSNPHADIQDSDYLGTLLRDPTASHLLETVVARCPNVAFEAFWRTYFKGHLARLAAHPVANFVVAKATERSSEEQLSQLYDELKDSANKLIRTSRTGVLRALIDRAAILGFTVKPMSEIVYSAFEINNKDDHQELFSCILALLPLSEYQAALSKGDTKKSNSHPHRGASNGTTQLEPKIQGSILLQALLRLPEPSNQFILDNLFSLSIEDRITIAHNASGSRVFDALLESPTVSSKAKRQFIMDLIGHYHILVDDKLGSRVGDRCWAFCDTYLKEKIAKSLIPQEQALAASFYGKFFARNLNLSLLQRRPQDWRDLQSERKRAQEAQASSKSPVAKQVAIPTQIPNDTERTQVGKRKRQLHPDNEIDALFAEKLGKKIKRAALSDTPSKSDLSVKPRSNNKDKPRDKDLDEVLSAIRTAPAGDKKRH